MKKKQARMLFAVKNTSPFAGSLGVINHYIHRALQDNGYSVDVINRDLVPRIPHAESLIPLSDAVRQRNLQKLSNPALTIYDDHGLGISVPQRKPNKHIILFHHGLRGNPGVSLASKAIDIYLCNSLYLQRVLNSLFLMPCWGESKVLRSDAVSRTRSIRLPVPLLEFPNGYPSIGKTLSASVYDALNSNSLLGHAIHRNKIDTWAVVSIMNKLSELAPEFGFSSPPKLFVSEEAMLDIIKEINTCFPETKIHIHSLFVPVPLLQNTELVKLMRSCQFCLSYNSSPESFGLYPLESVLCGCPVYTNGCGNLRFSIPPGHGVNIIESIPMALHPYRSADDSVIKIATQILLDNRNNSQYKAITKGFLWISQEYNYENMTLDISGALNDLDSSSFLEICFEELYLNWSPLVRQWDPATTSVISDHRSLVIGEDLATILIFQLGRSASDIESAGPEVWSKIDTLIDLGIVALQRR